MSHYFDHKKLEVYQASIEFVVSKLPPGRAYLADQLQRAGTSISLNVAESAGEFSTAEKCRFYRIGKRSATECAAIFDICRRLHLIDETHHIKGRELLVRIVGMLTKLAQRSSFVPLPVSVTVPDLKNNKMLDC